MFSVKGRCPRCASPIFVDGVCGNDDCNYPSAISNNERRREQERQDRAAVEERARKKRADQEGKRDKVRPSPQTPWIEKFGVVAALAAAAAAGFFVHDRVPDSPVAWLGAAAVAGVAAFALRQLLAVGLAVALIGGLAFLFLRDAPPPPAPVAAPAPAASPAPQASPAPPALAPPVEAPGAVWIGWCVENATGAPLAIAYEYGRGSGDEETLPPGETASYYWVEGRERPARAVTLVVRPSGERLAMTLGRVALTRAQVEVGLEYHPCGAGALPLHRLSRGADGRIRIQR